VADLGKNAKKRAAVAVARKLSVLLMRLWASGAVYEPLRNAAVREQGREGPSVPAEVESHGAQEEPRVARRRKKQTRTRTRPRERSRRADNRVT